MLGKFAIAMLVSPRVVACRDASEIDHQEMMQGLQLFSQEMTVGTTPSQISMQQAVACWPASQPHMIVATQQANCYSRAQVFSKMAAFTRAL
jgi:hypothetical protein